MPPQNDLSRISVGQFADRFRQEMVPLSNNFSYFFTGLPLSEEEVKEYLEEPIAALPPSIATGLPKTSVVLVPYLERVNGAVRNAATEMVSLEAPPENRSSVSAQVVAQEQV